MIKQVKLLICTLVVLVILPNTISIKCWDCRSDYDPRCAEPFDNSSIPLTDCSRELRTLVGRPTMCRKTKERVNEGGGWLIIRDCAHFDGVFRGADDDSMCFKTIDSDKAFVCFCNDKDGCNSSYAFTPRPLLLFLFVIVSFSKLRILF